jgi:hypothetical protein
MDEVIVLEEGIAMLVNDFRDARCQMSRFIEIV